MILISVILFMLTVITLVSGILLKHRKLAAAGLILYAVFIIVTLYPIISDN